MGSVAFTGRAVLALALLAGFYLLALAMAAGLLWMPYAEWTYGHRASPRLALFAIAGAAAILRGSLFVPRPPFRLPGPELRPEDHPELFALVRDVAGRMHTRVPRFVYLVPEVNAFVTETGGFLGFGATRVMGIGLGLLHVEDVSGLRATLAHEFGHYAGGHTRLGGIVYRTRAAIGQVLSSLGRSWVSRPFEWYGRLYMLVSNAVSRGQELEADRASVAIAGRRAHLESLRKGARGGVVFGEFVRNELAPLLEDGVCPRDLYAGFGRMMLDADAVGVDAALAARVPDRYDTHPSLAERVAFAEGLPDPGLEHDAAPAISLLRKPEAVEGTLEPYLLHMLGVTGAVARVGWEDLPDGHYAPRLAEEARRTAERLYPLLGAGPRYEDVALALADALASGSRGALALAVEPRIAQLPSADREEVDRRVVGRALGVLAGAALAQRGARWTTSVGQPLRMTYEGRTCDPLAAGMKAASPDAAVAAYRELVGRADARAASHDASVA